MYFLSLGLKVLRDCYLIVRISSISVSYRAVMNLSFAMIVSLRLFFQLTLRKSLDGTRELRELNSGWRPAGNSL